MMSEISVKLALLLLKCEAILELWKPVNTSIVITLNHFFFASRFKFRQTKTTLLIYYETKHDVNRQLNSKIGLYLKNWRIRSISKSRHVFGLLRPCCLCYYCSNDDSKIGQTKLRFEKLRFQNSSLFIRFVLLGNKIFPILTKNLKKNL